jgi:hypothetical protein
LARSAIFSMSALFMKSSVWDIAPCMIGLRWKATTSKAEQRGDVL